MRDQIQSESELYIKKNRFKRRWYKLMMVLASVVVFCTTYALILPAITMENQEPQVLEQEILPLAEEPEAEEPIEEVQVPEPELLEEIQSPAEEPAVEEPQIPNEVSVAENVPESPLQVPKPEQQVLAAAEGGTAPIKLEAKYIESSKLSYRTGSEDPWKDVTGASDIPGNAQFQLDISFKDVNIAALLAADCKITYEMPELLRNVSVADNIFSGTEKAGTMAVDGQIITLQFDEAWIKKIQDTGETVLSGSFSAGAVADLSKAPDGGNQTIQIGDATVTLNFENDLIAKYGEVDLEKTEPTLEEGTDGSFYLCYQLKVTAGRDGCPQVQVKDQLTFGSTSEKQYFDSYEYDPSASVTVDASNVMTWDVGNLAPNESKTLQYKVKLKPGYAGVIRKNIISNQADLYSKENKRDTDTQTFTPNVKVDMSKVAGTYDAATGTITYTVWVKADPKNSFTLDHVMLWDGLDDTVPGSTTTNAAILNYLSYSNDFKLYEGGNKSQNGSAGLTESSAGELVQIADNGHSFKYNIGDLKPGESKTLVYTVKVDEGVYTLSNQNFNINNRVSVRTDPDRTDGTGNQAIENYKISKNMNAKIWSRKNVGSPTTEDWTISMGSGGSFQVPKGSYKYQVVVNEAGDWNVSSAEMKDTLSDLMTYAGYVKVEAYTVTSGKNYATDAEAIAALDKLTPAETKWVAIDGQTSFAFTPKDIGFSEGNYAYRLTYYATPKNLGDISSVMAANQFDLTGEVVGPGGKKYTLGLVGSSTSVRLEGTNHFAVKKQFWYYDDTVAEGADKGKLYWIIQVNGAKIPKNTVFKDSIQAGNHKVHDLAAAFCSETITDFTQYADLTDLKTKVSLTEFTQYTKTVSGDLQLTLTEDVTLTGSESLYFIVATAPTVVPTAEGTNQKYENAIATKDPGVDTWVDQSNDFHYLVGGENIYKKLAQIFKVEAGETPETTKITHQSGDSSTILQNDYLRNSGSGIYAAWKVRINQASTLNGTYRIREQIPEGMEIVYIQRYSTGGGQTHIVFQEITDLTGWTRVEQKFTYHDAKPTPAIFYKKGQEVIWDVGVFTPHRDQPGGHYAEYLVVCKLTDPDVLLAGEEKTYTNKVSLEDQNGKEIGMDTDSITLTAPSLQKTGMYAAADGNRYPFKITLNEDGFDLIAKADTVKLIDEMSDTLIPDPSSIQVVNSKTNEAVSFTAAVEGHKLTLTLPDHLPLTITYEAVVNAAPGQPISISNNAHWEGYATPSGGSVKKDDFSYTAGATVGTSTSPKISVLKLDQYDTGKKLSGAEFTLTEMTVDVEGNLIEKASGVQLMKTTDSAGKATFGADTTNLAFNTIYRLVETEAPVGYVLDDTPHYIAVARKVGETYPTFPAQVNVWYASDEYTYTAYNHKGEIKVEKNFQNADGTPLSVKLNGTYTFGLYSNAEGTGTPISTASITFGHGTVTPAEGYAKFSNLDFGTTYYVFELNDQGNPILSGAGTVSGIPFVVSYDKNKITLTETTVADTVTVTNRMNYTELPASGGIGTHKYTLGGMALTGFAISALWYKQKIRKENK